MSGRELELSTLVGRRVCDADGRVVGRLEEVWADVALDESGEYVVREYHVGRYGPLGRIAGGRFMRQFLLRLPRLFGSRQIVVPWSEMDLSDPRRPRIVAQREVVASA